MQTIKIEAKPELMRVVGLNAIFTPTKIEIKSSKKYLMFSAIGSNPKIEPLRIILTKENWKRVIVALGEELSK